jgi:hypothetical protein
MMIVDNVWKLTNTVRVGLDARSSHGQRRSTFPDKKNEYRRRCEVNCDTWLGTGNVCREFPVSSAHVCVQSVRKKSGRTWRMIGGSQS